MQSRESLSLYLWSLISSFITMALWLSVQLVLLWRMTLCPLYIDATVCVSPIQYVYVWASYKLQVIMISYLLFWDSEWTCLTWARDQSDNNFCVLTPDLLRLMPGLVSKRLEATAWWGRQWAEESSDRGIVRSEASSSELTSSEWAWVSPGQPGPAAIILPLSSETGEHQEQWATHPLYVTTTTTRLYSTFKVGWLKINNT